MEGNDSQSKYDCMFNGCDMKGRKIGQLGEIPLCYCARHRNYGVEVLDFLIDSLFRHKLTKFLDSTKNDLFMENKPELCNDCYKKIADYVKLKVNEIGEIKDVIKNG